MSASPTPVNGTVYQRHQFRRQGSSCTFLIVKLLVTTVYLDGPGHVHNMALMVAPQKLDYSVTKVSRLNVYVILKILC